MPIRLRTLDAIAAIAALGAATACPPDTTVIYCNSRSDCAATETCSDGICRRIGTATDASNSDHAIGDAIGADLARADAAPRDAATPDANPIDARRPDAGTDATAGDRAPGADARVSDASSPDTRQPDAAQPDAAQSDAAPALTGICGDSARPCRITVDETVYQHGNLYMTPSLALDTNATPHLLFSHNLSGFFGYYAVRTGANSWLAEAMPTAVARGGLGIGASNTPYAVTYGGNFVVSLWRRDSTGWVAVEDVTGQNFGPDGDGVEIDPTTDSVHAAIAASDGLGLYALHTPTSGWTTRSLTAGTTSYALALSPQRTPHLAAIATAGTSGWKVYWAAPPAAPELVLALGSSGISRSQIALVAPPDPVDPGAVRPYLLFARPQGTTSVGNDLLVADRVGNWGWTPHQIAADTPNDDERCATIPTVADEICYQDYDESTPLALVADTAGAVRYLYAWQHTVATVRAVCDGQRCSWERTSDDSTGSLRLGWLDRAGDPHEVDLLDSVWILAAAARADALDRIHLVVVDDGAPPTGDRRLRYLRLEK